MKLPKFLQEKLTDKNARPRYFPIEMKEFINQYGKKFNYPNKKNLVGDKLTALWFRYMKSGIKNIGICEYENCTENKNIVGELNTNLFKISRGCCWSHSNKIGNLEKYGVEHVFQDTNTKNKIQKTVNQKYGCDNISQSSAIKEKKKQSLIKNYGVDHNMKSIEVKEKMKTNNLRKYGVEYTTQVQEFKDKSKNTCLEKYGVEYVTQTEEFKEKSKQTMLRKYGETNFSKTQKFKDDLVNFNIKKYGAKYPNQNPEEFERRQKIRFTPKEYKWKTGEISLVQGYEPIVLKELEEQGYKFEEVLTSPKDMPKIMYHLYGKEHRYYPDFFIPKDNIIIEVKSDYTLKADWDFNQAKFKATKSLGFDFRLEVR